MFENQLLEIAEQVGTPTYVYHREKIEFQIEELKNNFSNVKSRFFYACKALSNLNILKIIQQTGIGLDTVSIHEVKLGLKAGFEPKDILYTPNCVCFDEISEVKELGVHINIDNISILEQFGNQYGNSYPVMIRLNPHIMAGGNYKISTGHIDSKFGISIHQLRHIERIVKTTKLRVEGLHMHTGSEIKDVQVFLQGFEVMLNAVEHFPDIQYLDLGSGFKVPYKADEIGTNLQELAQGLALRMKMFEEEHDRCLELWFEPGKYVVSESGFFLTKANVIKTTPATVFVGINSGFNHLLRPMFYDAYHEMVNLSNPNGTQRIYTVVGNLCETDTFGWDRVLNEVREGDILAFKNAGAYCFEMASRYNSRLLPAEVLIEGNNWRIIRKRDTLEDLIQNQVVE